MIPARATELGLQHEVEEIPNSKNAKIHWLGDKTAKNVLLYFHGEKIPISLYPAPKMICSKSHARRRFRHATYRWSYHLPEDVH